MSRIIATGLMVLIALGGIGLRAQDEPVWKDIKRGPWKNPKHIPDGFTKKTVGRYEIQSNCDDETLEIVATHLNAMYTDGFKEFLRPTRTPSDKMVLKLLQDERQFLAYGQAYGAAAYFSPSDREMVGYDTGVLGGIVRSKKAETGQGAAKDLQRWMDRNEMDLLGVMSHEAWHQYFHWCCSSIVDFPAWCDEGISEYFYSCWVGDDKKLVLGAPNDVRLETVQELVARDRYVPFGTFVQYVQAEYYANPGANYAQGWAFTHFLMEHPDYKGKDYVSKFVKIFIDQHSVEKTVPRVFGKKPDWETMEADWKEWVLSIPRRADPLSPFIEETLAFNKKADERRAKLSPKVRKALEACLARRAPAPWEGKDAAPAAKAPAEKPVDGAEEPVGTTPEEKDGSK
ncbi:MAG: DUF1570 domain-containing protein [Planctomycetota bacterium]